jgi:TatD DNase family protein
MNLFDTHAHLTDEQLLPDAQQVIARANDAGVNHILTVGTTLQSSRAGIDLAQKHDSVYAAVGIHPNSCHEAAEHDWQQIVELAKHARVIAIGETGLDRYWDDAPFELQQDYFDRHMCLSQQTGLPFIVHMRECAEEIMTMLREARQRGPLCGIMHSFTGEQAMAAECVELGLHISFAGMVTFKKSHDLRAVAAAVPADRILVETDSPYLSPEPLRGKRPNEPARVVHTTACVAEQRGVSLEELANQTSLNAIKLFQLD